MNPFFHRIKKSFEHGDIKKFLNNVAQSQSFQKLRDFGDELGFIIWLNRQAPTQQIFRG